MRKIHLFLYVILLSLPLAFALEECYSPIEPDKIPCTIKSTWAYDDCLTTEVKIYNSTPLLLDTRNFTDFEAGRCNITWNYSERGTYWWNVSNGDSGSIVVEGYKMEFISLSIFGVFFVLAMIFIVLMHHYKQDEGSSVVYGMFAFVLLLILGSMTMFGFEIINSSLVSLPFNVNKTLGLLCYILATYSLIYSVQLWQFKKKQYVEKDDYQPL